MKLKFLLILLFGCSLAQAETPVVQWARSFGGSYFDETTGVALDSKGNSYVAGIFYSSLVTIGTNVFKNGDNYGGILFLVKYDQIGNIAWAKCIKCNNVANSLAIDNSDNIYVGGSFRNDSLVFGKSILYNNVSYNNLTPFIAKYDSNGNEIWAKGCTNPNKNTEMTGQISSICVDENNNIHALGTYRGSMSIDLFTLTDSNLYYPTLFIVKLDTNGKAIWAKDAQSNGSGWCNPTSIAVDPSGNSFIAGYYGSQSVVIGSTTLVNSFYQDNYDEIFIAKYDQAGNPLWAKSPPCKGSDIALSLSVDKSGNVYMGGFFGKNLGFQKTELCPIKFDSITLIPSSLYYNLFLAKYNSTGKVLWAKTVPKISKLDSNTGIYSIFTDNKNNVYTTGFYNYSITFDSISLSNNNGRDGDLFVNKSDSMGNIIWAKTFGGNLEDTGFAISGDNKGNLVLGGGIYSNNVLFGNDTLSSTGDLDVFVAKILLDTTHVYSTIKFCTEDSVITLTAPSNNSNYTWMDKSNKVVGSSQSLIVRNLADSFVYKCTFKNMLDSTIIYSYTLIKYDPKADFSIISDCETNSVQCTNLSTTNRGSLTYLWDFGDGSTSTETNPLHKFTTSEIHRVSLSVITSPLSCTNSISKSITFYPKPTIKIEGDTTICHGAPVTLKAQGADSYKWSTGSSTDSITVASTQKIWLLGYSASACVSDTAFIKVTDKTPIVSITGNSTYCPGLSATLKAQGANSYKWSNGATTDTIKVNNPGNVWVIGYSSTCVSDTVRFNVSEEPDFSVSVDGNLYICSGGSTTLTASGADSYHWSTGDKSNSITVNKAGNYSVSGTNKRGCEKKMDFNITEELLPDANFSVSNENIDSRHNKISCKAVAQSGVEYKWDMGDGSTENGSDINHSYNISNSSTSYIIRLTVTNKLGCTNSHSKEIIVALFIPNIFTPNGDGQNDIFMPNVDLEILDRNGMSIYKGTTGWDGYYHGKKMPDDTYYYVIRYKNINGQIQTQKSFVMLMR